MYGYIIFFSEANNCDAVSDTAFLNSIMFVILFVGYIFIFIYMMLLCTLPCVFMFNPEAREPQNEGTRPTQQPSQIPAILASLSKTHYDPDKFKHESSCIICLVDYQASDIVTQLKCDSRHYFHTACLESWIKQGHN